MTEALAINMLKNSSSKFQRIKMLKEKKMPDYNLLFSMTELKQSLQRANDSAAALD